MDSLLSGHGHGGGVGGCLLPAVPSPDVVVGDLLGGHLLHLELPAHGGGHLYLPLCLVLFLP